MLVDIKIYYEIYDDGTYATSFNLQVYDAETDRLYSTHHRSLRDRLRIGPPIPIPGGQPELNPIIRGYKNFADSTPGSVLLAITPVPLKFLSLPQNARIFTNAKAAFQHLQKYHGIDPKLARERLEAIKKAHGRGGADNVIFDRTGGIYNPGTREFLSEYTKVIAKKTVTKSSLKTRWP